MSTPDTQKTTDASSAPDGRVGSGPLFGDLLARLCKLCAAIDTQPHLIDVQCAEDASLVSEWRETYLAGLAKLSASTTPNDKDEP